MKRIFAHRTFRYLLLAAFGSELGSWIQLAASDWFVTSQSLDPLKVSLLGAAMSLPTFLFGIPSGVLADILGRRNVLLVAQLWMAGTATAMTLMLQSGTLTAPALIVLTFFLFSGMALQEPALYATFPEVVPRELLPAAVTLHGTEWACARVVGPIVGGAMIRKWGLPAAFLANVISYLGLIVFLFYWKPARQNRSTLRQFMESFQGGLQLVGSSARLRTILILAGSISFGSMAPIILTPLVARTTLHQGSQGFGMLISCLGVGSLLATLFAAGLILRFSARTVAVAGLATAGASIFLQSIVQVPVLFGALLVLSSFGSILATMAVAVAMQSCLPGHIRGRFMGYYLVVFAGGASLGAVLTGWTARHAGVPATQWASSVLLLLLATATMASGLQEDAPIGDLRLDEA